MFKHLNNQTEEKEELKEREYKPMLSDEQAHLFAYIAAGFGLTADKLLECFIADMVSVLTSKKITDEEQALKKWIDTSWFSQDDGLFSFLQFIVVTGNFDVVMDLNEKFGAECELIKELYEIYCSENDNHDTYEKEIAKVQSFILYIKNI